MARMRLSDPGVKERLQDLLAADTPIEHIAREWGLSKVTVYAWIKQMEAEMQTAVAARKETAGAALAERQFNLYDELASKARMLSEEIDTLRQMQRTEPAPQTALAIFRGAAVARQYLERMGELLGQLQPAPAANVHLTRIEQILNLSVPAEQIPAELRAVVARQDVLGGERR